jgi:hypothetical protein
MYPAMTVFNLYKIYPYIYRRDSLEAGIFIRIIQGADKGLKFFIPASQATFLGPRW